MANNYRDNLIKQLAMRLLCSMDFDESLDYAVDEMQHDLAVTFTDNERFQAVKMATAEYKQVPEAHQRPPGRESRTG
jgi:hypothetical protein